MVIRIGSSPPKSIIPASDPITHRAQAARDGGDGWRFAAPPWRSHIFSGDINGLEGSQDGARPPFLLASIARILYPMGCLACERPRPCFGWAHDPAKRALGS